MAKFSGMIGFSASTEGAGEQEGVVVSSPVEEKPYYGDVLENNRRWENGSDIQDDLTINNQISIVGNTFAYEHFFAMKYVRWMGTCWKITSVKVQRPRLLITIGGVYNGPTC